MPKIIKDLKEHIFEAAMSLFCEKQYNDVDMKMIAQKCGIAVGTLYNYYPNKKELYINIVENSWKKTFSKLHQIDELHLSPKQKIKRYIEILYDDIEKRQGLGKELARTNINDLTEDDRIISFKKMLISNMQRHIKSIEKLDIFKDDRSIDRKISETLLVTLIVLMEAHPEEKQANIDFLNEMLNAFVK